jgi:hypothetical protein
MTDRPPHLAILGAGPVGLEAALAAAERGWPFTVYEAGDRPAAGVAAWGHVRLFSPWDLDASPRARARLANAGRPVPEGTDCPTGAELVEHLLAPLAELPEIAPRLVTGARVVEVSRDGLVKSDEIGTGRRGERPFRLLVERGDDEGGTERIERAGVVLDCTGTWGNPNRLGDGGIAAPGERALGERIVRHPPDLRGDGDGWAGSTVLLVGAGHSAQTAARDLAALASRRPGTRVVWAMRSEDALDLDRVDNDPLPERARLADEAAVLAGGGGRAVEVHRGVVVEALEPAGGRVRATLRRRADGSTVEVEADRVLSLTGYVGDDRLYRQLQVHECYATSGPMNLSAALLGAAAGDCLTQTSHGVETLVNPEPGFFLLGIKSYGRNTTFLMGVGWVLVDEVFGLLDR